MQRQEAASIWKNLSPARTTFNCDHSFVYSDKVLNLLMAFCIVDMQKFDIQSHDYNKPMKGNYHDILLSIYCIVHFRVHVHLFNLTCVIGRPNIDMQAMEKGITINFFSIRL